MASRDAGSFDRLGTFYLGRALATSGEPDADQPILYDAKDLTTHAVCLGMTGSGKTGLCISLLEEAGLDGIPAIAIDPKGDLANLLLTFPRLRPEDFVPWLDEQEVARHGVSTDAYAETIAQRWRSGLSEWGQDGARIKRFRDTVELAIYTPGSTAGSPLTVLQSFRAPAGGIADEDAHRERVTATASGLLALVGEDTDPVKSRAHILVSTILDRAWREGQDLDVAQLIAQIQSPPVERIGVMALESFFGDDDRFELAARLNNLLASPGFSGWMTGEPLNIRRLLWTEDGRPRLSVISIAHLSDTERMFFVTILLNEVVAWMRRQEGSSTLRALLYMDEVMGYLPPTQSPPSKLPMLTLLKQARAYGLGVVLATQNPVDLDYKALSNAGTWLLGRLQTERDKARVLDGLEGASASASGFDRGELERTLSGLKSRVFVMHNVHDDAPTTFHTRWAMSYLRGPLTRAQIKRLVGRPSASAPATAAPATSSRSQRAVPPPVADDVGQIFLPAPFPGAGVSYRPAAYAEVDVHYLDARRGIDRWDTLLCLGAPGRLSGANVWDGAEIGPTLTPSESPEAEATFAAFRGAAPDARAVKGWHTKVKAVVYRDRPIRLSRCTALKLHSQDGEEAGEFMARVRAAAHAKRDAALEKLRATYAPKLARLQDRIRAAELKVSAEEQQHGQQRLQTAISVGATLLGALVGRRAASLGTVGRATTAVRGMGRTARERAQVDQAEARLADLRSKLEDLEAEFQDKIDGVAEIGDLDQYEINEVLLRPRKSDLVVRSSGVAWIPEGFAFPVPE